MIGSDTSPATIAMYRIDYDDAWSSDTSRYEGAKIGSTTCNSIAKELFITRLVKRLVQISFHNGNFHISPLNFSSQAKENHYLCN